MHSLYMVVDMRFLFEFLATQRTVEGFFSSVNQHMLFQSRPSKKEKNSVTLPSYVGALSLSMVFM
jgi:hypothetical protein